MDGPSHFSDGYRPPVQSGGQLAHFLHHSDSMQPALLQELETAACQLVWIEEKVRALARQPKHIGWVQEALIRALLELEDARWRVAMLVLECEWEFPPRLEEDVELPDTVAYEHHA